MEIAVVDIGIVESIMATMNFLKKAARWSIVSLCLLSIGSAAVPFDFPYSRTVDRGNEEIIGIETADLSGSPLAGLLAAGMEKSEYLTAMQLVRLVLPRMIWEVTASWYGEWHHNRLTANGQRFNMYDNTLAHKTLPLGTKVRLINLENGTSAEGIVNDRGPYIEGRDVDVSYAMAKQLGFVEKGVVKLRLEMM